MRKYYICAIMALSLVNLPSDAVSQTATSNTNQCGAINAAVRVPLISKNCDQSEYTRGIVYGPLPSEEVHRMLLIIGHDSNDVAVGAEDRSVQLDKGIIYFHRNQVIEITNPTIELEIKGRTTITTADGHTGSGIHLLGEISREGQTGVKQVALRIDVGRMVTIGAPESPMPGHGILAVAHTDQNQPSDSRYTMMETNAKMTITNAGVIYSRKDGIRARQVGRGTIEVTHSGSIFSRGTGIWVESALPPLPDPDNPARSLDPEIKLLRTLRSGEVYLGAALSIVSSGNIVGIGTSSSGIYAYNPVPRSKKPISLKITGGQISAPDATLRPNLVELRHLGLGEISAEISESAVLNAFGVGLLAEITNADNDSAIVVGSSGSITSGTHGILVIHGGKGNIEITHAGTIVSGISDDAAPSPVGVGLLAEITNADSGSAIKVENSGSITSATHGIEALHGGWGNIEITHTGTIESELFGIQALGATGAGASSPGGSITVTSSGDIKAAARTSKSKGGAIQAIISNPDNESHVTPGHNRGYS